MTNKAVVLLSGGLDSTTCLAIAQSQGFECHALSFSYGQRHCVELEAAQRVAQKMGASSHKIATIDLGLFGGSALTDNQIEVPHFKESSDIPVTYVPARNTIFLSMALGYAESIGAMDIFIGASSIDYSHYPDCRPEFMQAFQTLANLGTKKGVEHNAFTLHTPLQYLSKAQTVALGLELGVDYSITISCYQADSQGRACGICDSCTFRKRGFSDAGIADPTLYFKASL